MKKTLVFVFVGALIAIGAGFFLTRPTQGDSRPTVQIGGQTIHVDLAQTEAEREQGLSGRKGLSADEGMLFVFPEDGVHYFWMKDMLFSIDIIWISADGHIVFIAPSLSPATYPQAFGPNEPTRYVLEVRAGFAESHNVKVGDQIDL